MTARLPLSVVNRVRNTLILGAGGRDFHNFLCKYKTNAHTNVVAFTATQIPDIDDKIFPSSLAGSRYPNGIPIFPESEMERLVKDLKVDEVVFGYSDVAHPDVMHMASRVLATGASFHLVGPKETMLESKKPCIGVVASRTGAGKSQTSRRIVEIIKSWGKKVVSIRHPMPYGDLAAQAVQRFATLDDLKKHKCTIEEMEEYEPHIAAGNVIYSGVDYEAILEQAEEEADVILFDGGNNDFPFYKPDLFVTVVDPLRPGDEMRYHPGETNLRMADVVVINKIDTADREAINEVRTNIHEVNPNAIIIDGASPISVADDSIIKGKRVLCVEDGPTLTHGQMKIGCASVAARKFGAKEIVDPRPFVDGKIARTFRRYPNIGQVLPAMGYDDAQVKDLENTINNVDCDSVIIGTPIDLNRIVNITKPSVRVQYELQEIGKPTLEDALKDFKLLLD